MGVQNTKGLTIDISKGAPTLLSLVPTAITKAKPAEVTVADTTGAKDGDVVSISGSGFTELDGKSFIISGLTGTTFDLLGSDTTGSAGTLGTTPKADVTIDGDMIHVCANEISISSEPPAPVGVPSFCDPSQTIPGSVSEAGTLTLGLWNDITAVGYSELLDAEIDGVKRFIRVMLPGNGYLLFEGVVNNVSFTDIPIEGSAAITANIVLATKPKHLF